MPLGGLPSNKMSPLVVFCQSGNRSGMAAAYLENLGYANVINGGGPLTPQQWAVLQAHASEETDTGSSCNLPVVLGAIAAVAVAGIVMQKRINA
mmetsp:Transcript_103644/g.184137  ORF Transcript_103644/g.184137 Transcript_103644/m.184137 type:complete len:94 (+) Transcript_103644:278-559(+)